MKRFLSIILSLLFITGFVFAEEEGDEYDDGYVYEVNGAGDQFIKINLGSIIPLNFSSDGINRLYSGGVMELGYYRFLNKWLAVGGEMSASYNISVGEKILVMIPFTFGIMYQPTYNDFEFPIFAEIGFSYESWQNMDYFPSLAAKLEAGGFYRINEICSVGLNTSFMWIPQWFKDSQYNKNGLFMTASIGARYHF
ncbi:MAG: hypothetical protein MJ174_05125 [Treponema sp.]|nr:hypothetical protein [Treponema sp.]